MARNHKYSKLADSLANRQRIFASKYEALVCELLCKKRIPFEYQYPFLQDDRYWISDFYIPSLNLVIEVDGAEHIKEENMERDFDRDTRVVNGFGHNVARFSNEQVINAIKVVSVFIDSLSPEPHPRIYDYRIFCKEAMKVSFDGYHGSVKTRVIGLDGSEELFSAISSACSASKISYSVASLFFTNNKDANIFIHASGVKIIRSTSINEGAALKLKQGYKKRVYPIPRWKQLLTSDL